MLRLRTNWYIANAQLTVDSLTNFLANRIKLHRKYDNSYLNTALAQVLFVSANNVRMHLRIINLQLGIRNRTEAIALARGRD